MSHACLRQWDKQLIVVFVTLGTNLVWFFSYFESYFIIDKNEHTNKQWTKVCINIVSWIEESDWYCLIDIRFFYNKDCRLLIQKDSRKTPVDWTTKFTSWFFVIIKFIYSEKFPKIWKKSPISIKVCNYKKCDIFSIFYGLLRISELYYLLTLINAKAKLCLVWL